MRSSLLLVAALLAACAGESTSETSEDVVTTESSLPEAPAADARTRGPRGEVVLATEDGEPITIGYETLDGIPIAEGDVVVPTELESATMTGRRWPGATVPYVIEPDLPDTQRVFDAIAHWAAKTNVRLVPRTNQNDYVSFHPSTGCSSMIGKQGGKQTINLVTGETASNVVGIAINRSNGNVYYFYKRGFATAGTTTRTDQYQSHFKYVLPGALTPANVVEMGFANNGHLFVWYTDGTVSEGTVTNFAQYAAPRPYSLAPNKAPSDVAAIAIAKNDQTYVFYKDGKFTVGTTTDTDSVAAPAPYAVPSGVTLAHVDVAQNGAFWAFYSNGRTTSGTAANLAATTALAAVAYTGHCAFGQTVHEIGHAVGLFHEQTRQDRDAYVKINFENITSGQAYNFNKYSAGSGQDTGPYDYDSIMHYDSYAFSANGKPTIEKVGGGLVSGQRQTLSVGDVAALRGMYPTAP